MVDKQNNNKKQGIRKGPHYCYEEVENNTTENQLFLWILTWYIDFITPCALCVVQKWYTHQRIINVIKSDIVSQPNEEGINKWVTRWRWRQFYWLIVIGIKWATNTLICWMLFAIHQFKTDVAAEYDQAKTITKKKKNK